MTRFKAAVVQAGAVPFDARGSVEKACGLLAEAAETGAKLAVFPEGFVSAYPKGLKFGAWMGLRSEEGRDEFKTCWQSAIEIPGPETERLGKSAHDHGMHMVIGVIERDAGTLYCTALFFGPDGGLLGRHRKLMPTGLERLTWGFGDGSTLPVLDTGLGKVGCVICWENYMPLLRMTMYSKGIQLYCAITADDRDTWLPSMRHIACEGRCFVLSSCQFIKRGAFADDYRPVQGDDPDTVLMRGGSCIVNPFGEVLAGPVYEGECILTAEIDLDEIARGKYDLDVVGHYARPDVFRLHVNESPMPAVVRHSPKSTDPFKEASDPD